jgi:outer membrane protein assembly factor BamB
VIVAIFWIAFAVGAFIDKMYFHSFLFQLGSSAFFFLFFFGWWWFNRGLAFGQKISGFVIIAISAAVAFQLLDHTVNHLVVFRLGLPLLGTVLVLWMYRARRLNQPVLGAPFVLLCFGIWIPLLLLRSEGADSELKQAYHWRWSPSPEEVFLTHAREVKPKKNTIQPLALAPSKNEWTSFRGSNRDGIVTGSSISTNWNSNPPALLWKHAVGPAWSGITVIGPRLFTQEQRGPNEVVVCYDAQTGDELWVHEEAARFEESLAGAGPRGTPTFDNGKLYTLGATGVLLCLDAVTGKQIWKKQITDDSHSHVPMWGFSSSPLIVDGKVLVHAGGDRGLLAYRIDEGELAWAAPAGQSSYSSPELATIDGVPQILMLHDFGLVAVDLATGKKLWEAGEKFPDGPRSSQPRLVGSNDLVTGALVGLGTSRIHVSKSVDQWNVTTNWVSKDLKPEFPDFVVFKDHAFGFDAGLFTCINLADGKRVWKEGRYGRGQVLLLVDQNLLLVASESGELILLAADTTASGELGRFKALEGKTWNGPTVRADRIYHRNAQEMACYSCAEAPAKKIAER